MDKTPKAKHIRTAVISAIIAFITVFFITDSVITKSFGKPPVFCVKVITYDDGVSASYYGAGYKIKRSYSINDGTDSYQITLWLLPYSISL